MAGDSCLLSRTRRQSGQRIGAAGEEIDSQCLIAFLLNFYPSPQPSLTSAFSDMRAELVRILTAASSSVLAFERAAEAE